MAILHKDNNGVIKEYIGGGQVITPNTPLSGAKNNLDTLQLNGVNYKVNTNIYSESAEQEIGTWTDGKKIYRKVLTKTMSQTYDSIDLTSWNIDTLIKQTGFNLQTGSTTQNQTQIPIYVSENDYAFTFFRNTTKVLEFRCGSSVLGKFTLILEYTKSSN